MSQQLMNLVESSYRKSEVPFFEVGDTVDVHTRILEGEKERIQIFSGTVIARSGSGTREMFTVRRIVAGEGMERKFPLHLAWGISYFPNPSLLYTIDVDYYQTSEIGRANILNYSGGMEYYFNPTNAIRFGLFTNYTNLPIPDSSTKAPYEYLDIHGASFGYTSYSSSSSLTLGTIYTFGSGKAWLYSGRTETRKLTRESLTLVFSASSNL